MAKKNGKKITIDQLAIIINDGFNGQMEYMEKKFNAIDERFSQVALKKDLDEVRKDVKYIKENLKSAAGLEKEVDYIKNTLGISELKK